MADVLAIVGSTRFIDEHALHNATTLIEGVLTRRRPNLIVSGAAPGIDALAATMARERDIELREFPPAHPRWEPDGYKQRNDLIADSCTRLMRIACRWATTYGSGYTHDRASAQGKLCWSITLPTNLRAGRFQVTGDNGGPVTVAVRDGSILDAPGYVRALGWENRSADAVITSLAKRRIPVIWRSEPA
jgi:hypothetical protein